MSKILKKWPLAFRSSKIASTGPSPTPLSADKPKRICPCGFTLKLSPLSLMSGPSTSTFCFLHSFKKNSTLVISFLLCDNTEAINSAG